MSFRSALLHRLALAAALAVVALPVLAADAPEQAAALTRQLMSPFCPGLLLADCQSSAASELRGEIRARLEAGESRSAIVEDLVARYGEEIRGTPEPQGFGLLLWVLPVAVAAATLSIVIWRFRRYAVRRAGAEPRADVIPPEDPRTASRIDHALGEME